MNPLLQQFIQESRDFLQSIGAKLIDLEEAPGNAGLMDELFRLVHTLKGNSGLFNFPEMTRVLHAGEDLMDAVRDGRLAYGSEMTDRLLDAMDFVGMLIDEVEQEGAIAGHHAQRSNELMIALRTLIPESLAAQVDEEVVSSAPREIPLPELASIPEQARMEAWRLAISGTPLFVAAYRPDEDCFFKGEDPFHQARRTPGLLWGRANSQAPWPAAAELDFYRCQLDFYLLLGAQRAEIEEHFRYTPEQIFISPLDPLALVIPGGHPNGGPVYGDFVVEALQLLDAGDLDGLRLSASTMLELSGSELWLSSDLRWLLLLLETKFENTLVLRLLIEALNTLSPPDLADLMIEVTQDGDEPGQNQEQTGQTPAITPLTDAEVARVRDILSSQQQILALPDEGAWLAGRLKSVANTIMACLADLEESVEEVAETLALTLEANSAQPLSDWLEAYLEGMPQEEAKAEPLAQVSPQASSATASAVPVQAQPQSKGQGMQGAGGDADIKFGRRAEDAHVGKILKVDQIKIDRLMNLIGEMVVAKNSLPYLANRAENQYGVRELSREIKVQYAVINRIAEEMQDAIMQVRMMPVSFIFQRFPRLVRDISRKLGKEVELVLEGEDTEADKNIVESLADPLIHIVRNSLDHGLEVPNERLAAGKSRAGLLTIRALQESDRALIEIIDDGRGIDHEVIKRKAYEKGIIDDAQLERISDQDAVNLVFAAGFSTVDAVTDLSGRGVGMDVVRNAIDKVGGSVDISSQVGKGTRLRLSLPLSMAVTNVMIIESDSQIFGIPMDLVVETVRLPRQSVVRIKHKKTTVLRGRIIPLVDLNALLNIDAEPIPNEEDEFAVLVVRVGREQVGLILDEFREVVDVILKPLPGDLGKINVYAGSALLGDGSVLMVLNPKELI